MKNLKRLFIALTALLTGFLTSCSSEDDQADVVTKEEQAALDSFSKTKVKLDDTSDFSFRVGGDPIKAVIFKGVNYTGKVQTIRIPRSRSTYIWANFSPKSIQVAPGCRVRIRWWKRGRGFRWSSGARDKFMTVNANLGNPGRAIWIDCNDNRRVLKGIVSAGNSQLYLFKNRINLTKLGRNLADIFNDRSLKFHPINNKDVHSYVMFHKDGRANSRIVHILPTGRYHSRARKELHKTIPFWKDASYISITNLNWKRAENLKRRVFRKVPRAQLVRRDRRRSRIAKIEGCALSYIKPAVSKLSIYTIMSIAGGCVALNVVDGEALAAPCMYAAFEYYGGVLNVVGAENFIECIVGYGGKKPKSAFK